MKNIEKGTIKYLILLIISISIFGMILYPVFDLIISKFITNSKFVYSIKNYIVSPIVAAIIAGTVLWIVDKKANN